MNNKYLLGLDIGISSVGWGLVGLDEDNKPYRIIDLGVKMFSAAEVPKTGASKTESRRNYRGARRIIRRREFRVDRTKHLLNVNGYLGKDVLFGKVDEVNNKLENIFNDMVNNYYKGKNTNPYILKVEALDRKLNKDELSIILVHYVKHRGYKSNRTDESNDKDIGKVKEEIKQNEFIMQNKGYRIASEMFVNEEKFKEKIRNSKDSYKVCITREMYLDEINKVLNSQVRYGLITEEFKNDFINIWQAQRNYSKGPGGNSKYGGDLIKKMTGVCKFDGLPRAPKCAPTTEIFVAIQTLQNIRYKENSEADYKSLTMEEINKVLQLAKKQDNVTFSKLLTEIGLNKGYIKGLYSTKKEKQAAINKFIDKENIKEFKFNELTDQQRELFEELKLSEINHRICLNLKNYSIFRKVFTKLLGTDKWKLISENYTVLDQIAEILTNYKLDDDVLSELKKIDIEEIYFDAILELPNFKDHSKLSLDLMRKLIDIMLNENLNYDKAMLKLGFNHSNLMQENEKQDLLIAINQNNEITNQRVIRSLSQARGIINSIIKKYGMPERINIETARELSKNMKERRELINKRDENFENNQNYKKELFELGLFSSIDSISNTDILKFKLWKEQIGKCSYSLETIRLEELFKNNMVQIDHILPYSRTFNDSYFNKTLVLSKYNQEKGNRIPFEWFGKTSKWEEYKSYIKSLNISDIKKDNYLLEKLTLEMENEFRNQNLNDTKYISKYLISYIKANLNVSKVGAPSGNITGKLRNYWHLNGLTHSLESDSYYKNISNLAPSKNRDNNLHHALDALLIAVSNESVIRSISNYERFKRYIDNKSKEELLKMVNNSCIEERNEYFDDNGELVATNFTDYLKEIIKTDYLITRKNNTVKTILPEPYIGFSEEAKIRVYEQNKDLMRFRLKDFNYTNVELDRVEPVIPKFEREKIGGRLHGETLYRIKKYDDNDIRKISRVDIASSSFNAKSLKNILEKDGGSKEVYLTIKEWLGNDTGDIAYKKNGGYPKNSKSGNYIKKIRVEEEYKGKGHILNNNVVDKESIMQIDIYISNKDQKLNFVGLDTFDILKLKKHETIELDLWRNQTKHTLISSKDIKSQYTKLMTLKKNDYVKIKTFSSKVSYGYILGFSSGRMEIKSALGDGFDLIGEGKIFDRIQERYQITVSSICEIERINLNNLGKVE